MSRMLVTGAAGLSGSHLSERALSPMDIPTDIGSWASSPSATTTPRALNIAEPWFELVERQTSRNSVVDLFGDADVASIFAARPGHETPGASSADHVDANKQSNTQSTQQRVPRYRSRLSAASQALTAHT